MLRGRLRKKDRAGGDPGGDGPGPGRPDQVVEIDPAELTGVFKVPDWLRNIGLMSWLLLGITLLLGGLIWLASLTEVIVIPVLTALIVATVATPVVSWLNRHHLPRGLAAGLLMLGLLLLAVGLGYAVVAGIVGQASDIGNQLDGAKETVNGWLKDLGVSSGGAENATGSLSSGSKSAVSALLKGVAGGLVELSSLIFFLVMAALSTFFLLKDGPSMRNWAEGHSGLPAPVTRIITQRAIESMRGYFVGVTVVAAFSAVVVGIGTLILGVPYLGAIVGVTFIAGYVPYIGAWAAGAFAVLLALGSSGTDAAIGMVVVQLLANGALQQMVQPFAMGAALGIHPLVVLVVTIAGGALFGTIGLILAAPVVSATVRISSDLARARAEAEAAASSPEESPAPAPAGA